MGNKNFKGLVTISNANNRIRLRWNYQGKRYSINLLHYNKINLVHGRSVAVMIEQDIALNRFDFTLDRYKTINTLEKKQRSITEHFQHWCNAYRHRDCEVHKNYNVVRNMIRKWEPISPRSILSKLNSQRINNKTYNRRLRTLKDFTSWLFKQDIWTFDPLEDVRYKDSDRPDESRRKPFTNEEIGKILKAFKEDTFNDKKSTVKHSHYYPFIYFLMKTGVRNAEAIGLRVSNIDLIGRRITIKEVLARSLFGSNSKVRIRKETKNGKIRELPLTDDLAEVLSPLLLNRTEDDLVFTSPNGLCIDDRMFQRRIFSKVLKNLNIPHRVLYACRHTFGSRCINEGITPVMTAFLMGNNPEVALRHYTHQVSVPTSLPELPG